jgi:hypothetical protein
MTQRSFHARSVLADLWPDPCLGGGRIGAHSMTDLWILALTVGLFGAAAWFVRLCERM